MTMKTLYCLIIIITFHTITAASADPQTAALGIIQRLAPDKADQFILETIPSENDRDVFEIDNGPDGKIIIRGSSGVAIASGWNWYLKYYCHCHVSLTTHHGDKVLWPISQQSAVVLRILPVQ